MIAYKLKLGCKIPILNYILFPRILGYYLFTKLFIANILETILKFIFCKCKQLLNKLTKMKLLKFFALSF